MDEGSDTIDESKILSSGYLNPTNLGPVPSQIEVQNAISDLQSVMHGFCGTSSGEGNNDFSRSVVKSLGQMRLVDAYKLMQTDPLVKRLVLSISSDAEVWDAIMKNDAVKDLQGSFPLTAIEEGGSGTGYDHDTNSRSLLVKWFFAIMKSKIIEFMEKLEVLMPKTLPSVSKKRSTSEHDGVLEEKVQSSLLLSVVILVIVFVTRSLET